MSPRVISGPLPGESALHARKKSRDFLDCYSVASDATPREAADIITRFPAWARLLLSVRRVITAPFGLINNAPTSGDTVGIFPVESENAHELIAGFDDRHLDFRVAVLSQDHRVHLATWVHPHNIGGHLYLATIMPFHILIARDALSRVASVRPLAA